MNTTDQTLTATVPYPPGDCPAPTVRNVDYHTFRALLLRMDVLLRTSGLEQDFCLRSLAYHQAHRRTQPMTPAEQDRFHARSRVALRCHLLRTLLGVSLRAFSRALVTNLLWLWFCGVTPATAPSKSQLARFARWLPEAEVRACTQAVTRAASQPTPTGAAPLGLRAPLALATGWGDSTALATPIHWPVDWLLLRDAVRTLIRAIQCIRRAGLRCRMPAPATFLTTMNRLSMRMSQVTRAATSGAPRAAKAQARQRPRVTRALLRVLTLVEAHAQRHLARLQRAWPDTALSQRQMARIADRITRVLAHLPQVRAQVQTRLLQAQAVAAGDKLLSLYHPTTCVLVRGKTGRLVEFGHPLWVVEQRDGLVVDWQLAPTFQPDPALFQASLSRLQATFPGQVRTLVADRGSDSPAVRAALAAEAVRNLVAPRSLRAYRRHNAEPLFRACHRRRAQTEGRIGILKRGVLRVAQRAQSDPAREQEVTWAMLTHNLWVLARLPQAAAVARAA